MRPGLGVMALSNPQRQARYRERGRAARKLLEASAALAVFDSSEARINPNVLPRLNTVNVRIRLPASEEDLRAAWSTLAHSAADRISPLGYTDYEVDGWRVLTLYWIGADEPEDPPASR